MGASCWAEAKKANLEVKEVLSVSNLERMAQKYGVGNPDELLATVGFGRVPAQQVLQKITGKDLEEKTEEDTRQEEAQE